MIQKTHSFFFHKFQLISYTSNLRFLYKLKHKVDLSERVCGIFNFRFRLVFIDAFIFLQQKHAFFILNHNFFQNKNNRKAAHS